MRRLPLSTENVPSGSAFSSLSPPYQFLCTRSGGGPGRAGSALRKGSLDGRCVSCDFTIFEAKEPDILDCFISPENLGWWVELRAALKSRGED